MRSKETNGKIEESGDEFSFELTRSSSVPSGRQERNPCSCWNERRLGVDELRVENAADIAFGLVDLLFRIAIEREIETDIKKFLLRLLQTVAQALEVLVCGVEQGVAHEPFRLRAR